MRSALCSCCQESPRALHHDICRKSLQIVFFETVRTVPDHACLVITKSKIDISSHNDSHRSLCIHPHTQTIYKERPLFSSISAWHGGPHTLGHNAWRKEREPPFSQQHGTTPQTTSTSPHIRAGGGGGGGSSSSSYDGEPFDAYELKRQHRSDVIKAAVDYVMQSGLPAYRVCTMFNIPQATLYRHLTKAHKLQCQTSGTPAQALAGPAPADQAPRGGAAVTHSAGGGEADAALPHGDVQANRGEARAYAHGSGAVQTVAAREVYSHRDRDVLTSAGGVRTCFDSPNSQSEKARSGYLDGSTHSQSEKAHSAYFDGSTHSRSEKAHSTYFDSSTHSQSEKAHSHRKGFREYSSEGPFIKTAALEPLSNESSVDFVRDSGKANRHVVQAAHSRNTAELGGGAPGSDPVIDLVGSSDEMPDSDPTVISSREPVNEQRETETADCVDSGNNPGP